MAAIENKVPFDNFSLTFYCQQKINEIWVIILFTQLMST